MTIEIAAYIRKLSHVGKFQELFHSIVELMVPGYGDVILQVVHKPYDRFSFCQCAQDIALYCVAVINEDSLISLFLKRIPYCSQPCVAEPLVYSAVHIAGIQYYYTPVLFCLLIKRRLTKDTKSTKAENVGKERYDVLGYYATLGSVAAGLHRYLSMDVLMNSSAGSLEEYIAELNERISGIKKLDETMVKRLAEQMGV